MSDKTQIEELNMIYSLIGGCLRNEESDYAVKTIFNYINENYTPKTKYEKDIKQAVIKAYTKGTRLMEHHSKYGNTIYQDAEQYYAQEYKK